MQLQRWTHLQALHMLTGSTHWLQAGTAAAASRSALRPGRHCFTALLFSMSQPHLRQVPEDGCIGVGLQDLRRCAAAPSRRRCWGGSG